MRGTGTLRTIVGRPIFGKKKKQQEPDLHEGPHKRQKVRKAANAAGPPAGQRSIINFYQVAAPKENEFSSQSLSTPSSHPAALGSRTHRAASAPPLLRLQGHSASTTAAGNGNGRSSRPQPSASPSSDSREVSPDAGVTSPLRPHRPVLISTRVVGRQHQAASWPPAGGCELLLVREPNNPVDPSAILVCSVDNTRHSRTHGHLPAAVACHLAPLLDTGRAQIRAQLPHVLDTGRQPQQAATGAQPQPPSPQPSHSSPPEGTPHNSQDRSTHQLEARSGSPDVAVAQHQQQQQHLQLHVTVSCDCDPEVAAAAQAAVDRAASAGTESLQPARSSGVLLSSAFDHTLSQTRQHDHHLLSPQEQAVLQHMQALPAASKALLLRLLLRKRTWFELQALSYADVPQPEAAARRLSAVGLLQWDSDPHADLDSLLQELPVVVLKQVLAALLPKGHPAVQAAAAAAAAAAHAACGTGGPNKAALISSIQANASRARLQAAISAAAGPCVSLTPAAVNTFARLQRLYFMSPGHDLSMFVAVERGAVSYTSYPIQRTQPVFTNRQQLLEYEAALDLAGTVDTALEAGNTELAWQLLQPALTALQAGVHKSIVWDEACAPVPNPRPRQRSAPPPACTTSSDAAPATGAKHHDSALRHVPSAPAALGEPAAPAAGATMATGNHPAAAVPPRQLQQQQPLAVASNQPGLTCCKPSEVCDLSEMCDLTQASSSDVTWDTSDAAGSDATAPTAPVLTAAAAAAAREQQAVDDHMPEHVSCSTGSAVRHAPHPALQDRRSPHEPSGPAAAAAAAAAAEAVTAGASTSGGAGAEGPGPPLFFARFCAGWVYGSLGTVAVSLLEKQKRWGDAVELLRLLLGGNACVSRRGDWWTRLAINLQHLHRTEDALEAVEAALADTWVRGGDLLGLQRRYLRLGKPPRRWKRPAWSQQVAWEPPEVVITARPLNNNTGTKSRFYAPDNSLVTVEQLALQHYASQAAGSWQGLHCEGGVWATLFTLLLWDVIFMGVPDVFRSPFQTCPLDLDTDAFYPARRQHLDTALAAIADGQAGSILAGVWAANAGVLARGVDWQRFSQQSLLEICDCVGGLGLAAVLRLMAEDHAGAAGGLPDLLLWRPADQSAKLVEVKGPRDRLSHQQRFWLAHMANNTLQVEVLKVKEPVSKRK